MDENELERMRHEQFMNEITATVDRHLSVAHLALWRDILADAVEYRKRATKGIAAMPERDFDLVSDIWVALGHAIAAGDLGAIKNAHAELYRFLSACADGESAWNRRQGIVLAAHLQNRLASAKESS